MRGVEFEILCSVARPDPDLARTSDLLRQIPDFAALIRLGRDHGVLPDLAKALRRLDWSAVPPATRATLESFERRHAADMLFYSSQLRAVCLALVAANIPFAAIKGAALAMVLHGDLAARQYNDIDIVVPAGREAAAEQVLAGLGYVSRQGDRAFRTAFLAYQGQYALVREDVDLAVDLHWSFSGVHVPFPLGVAEIWPRLERVRIGDQEVPTIFGADLALLLAGHGTKERWRTLGWVRDFAVLVERRPELDWDEIHRRARQRGCGDTVLVGCLIAHELLGAALPQALTGAIRARPRAPRLAAVFIGDLRQEKVGVTNFSDLALCDSAFGRMLAALRLALTPTPGDYAALPLARALWPLYYLTRPFRLAFKGLF